MGNGLFDDDQLEGGNQQDSEKKSLLDTILSFFMRNADPEREKKRVLKEIGKALSKSKYKYYKPKTEEAHANLAKLFFNIYKTIAPAQLMLEKADSSKALKLIIIESFLNDDEINQKDYFEEDHIRKRLGETEPKKVYNEIKEHLVNYYAAFTSERTNRIDQLYSLLAIFLEIIHYDYFFLLKKFDSRFVEGDFAYNPRFEDINGEYISDDLKDFLEVLPLIDTKAQWDKLFDILAVYKGDTEVLNREEWKKIVKQLTDIRNSKVLEMMVRHIDKDPDYTVRFQRPSHRIVEEYLQKVKNQTEITMQKVIKERKNQKIDALAQKVFGTTAISRMKFYTDKANLGFSKKMLGGYTHIEPMNYLKAFLLDYFKKDIRELVDILLIRGKWSTNLLSQQLSESFHGLMQLSDELMRFDESLSEEGELGASLQRLLKRTDKDKSSTQLLRKELKAVNDNANRIINESGQHLIAIAKSLKNVVEDYGKKPHELLINWKELEGAMDGNVTERISGIYKQIYYFIQLLQFFIKKQSSKE